MKKKKWDLLERQKEQNGWEHHTYKIFEINNNRKAVEKKTGTRERIKMRQKTSGWE